MSYDFDPSRDGASKGVIVNLSASSVTTPDSVTVAAGKALDGWGNTDTLSGFEKIFGSHFNDYLVGSTGVNDIKGGAGDDTIDGGGGIDTIDGGTGFNTLLHHRCLAEPLPEYHQHRQGHRQRPQLDFYLNPWPPTTSSTTTTPCISTPRQ